MSTYNYSQYADDENSNGSNDDSGADNGGYDDSPDMTLTLTPHAAIEGTLTKVFGNGNSWGESLGLVWEDVELVDGCLYYDSEKNKHKVFSWKDVVGISPEEGDVSAGDANQYLVKNYGGTEKRYELVEAVVPDADEPVSIGDVIMWYGGSEDFGPKSASVTLAKMLTRAGRDAVTDREDVMNWLYDTSSDNLLRADLQGRRLAFFEVKKQSNTSDRQFHHPIVVDVATGANVTVANSGEGTQEPQEAAGEDASGSETQESGAADGALPEPVADFVSTCDALGFDDRDRAATLLADLVADDGNDLTAEMVTEVGGEADILDMVIN